MRMKVTLVAIIFMVIIGLYFAKPASSPGNVLIEAPEVIKEPEKALEISVSISPEKVIQGEPALIEVSGTTTAKSITFEGKELKMFSHKGKPSALIGIDLRKATGVYPVAVTLDDGSMIKKNLVVGERVIVKEPFSIPEKLGGDTPESEQNLISTLVQEGAIINSVPTASEKLWSGEFRFPLEGEITVTDSYGYSRLTGASTIAHKGTDFRAKVGTNVYAMNAGTVRYTGYLRNYGYTIVLDHGLGLQTVYMHLSEVLVKNGEKVEKSALIAKSGDTGYVLGPHLHISLKIDRVSVDPMKFMELTKLFR